jgi:hypothetical protein
MPQNVKKDLFCMVNVKDAPHSSEHNEFTIYDTLGHHFIEQLLAATSRQPVSLYQHSPHVQWNNGGKWQMTVAR